MVPAVVMGIMVPAVDRADLGLAVEFMTDNYFIVNTTVYRNSRSFLGKIMRGKKAVYSISVGNISVDHDMDGGCNTRYYFTMQTTSVLTIPQ